MARYRLSNVSSLARQMKFAPPAKRQAQICAAEELLHSLDRGKAYPFDFVVYRITGYRPRHAAEELLTGLALQHDLGLLIEQISDSLDAQTSALAEPVLTIDDVRERFSVTSKTIQRWRRRGLPARRFIFPDGKRRVGFLVSSVERFFALHREAAHASFNLGQVDLAEHEMILRNARRLASRGCDEGEISRRIARKLNRAPLAIVHTLRRHDAQQPQEAILPRAATPLADETRLKIIKGWRRGIGIAALSAKARAPRCTVYRTILEDRVTRLAKRRVRFIDDSLYHDPDAAATIEQIMGQEELAAPARMEDNRVPRDLPPYLQDLYRTPLLSHARERALFLCFNFHKYRFEQARRRIDLPFARARDLAKLEQLWHSVVQSKNAIVRANLRLVVGVARKHLRANLSLMELISDGNITLMRAVESFDAHLGHRFSTYATLALMKGFARSVPAMLSAQLPSRAAVLGDVADHHNIAAPQQFAQRDEIRALLRQLDDRERSIVRGHFGLGGSSPKTYEQLGQCMGLSKQRVRQIEQAALVRLRSQAKEPPTK